MSETNNDDQLDPSVLKTLSTRWNKVTLHAQCSPLEDLTISCLAKNAASRPWPRTYTKVKGDTLARYINLSFEELMSVENLDLKTATHLLEICEATLLFEKECSNLAMFEGLETQATNQRLRFIKEYGLYQDYPIALTNLDPGLLEMCQSEEVLTLIDLMGFIDQLADRTWVGGELKKLQNVFAHGDEKGLCEHFPYRMGHRGFHLPEALAICLKRLPKSDQKEIFEYHENRKNKSWFGMKQAELPQIIEARIIPDFFHCLNYFGQRQASLLIRLHDSAFLTRELMFLNDPNREDVIHWLLHLSLSIFRPSRFENVEKESKRVKVDKDSDVFRELKVLAEGA